MKQSEILDEIIKKNGWKHQYIVAVEELAELTKELTKAIRDNISYAHLCEEIADVEIVLAQIKRTVPRSSVQIALFKSFKIKRLEKLYLEGVEK